MISDLSDLSFTGHKYGLTVPIWGKRLEDGSKRSTPDMVMTARTGDSCDTVVEPDRHLLKERDIKFDLVINLHILSFFRSVHIL